MFAIALFLVLPVLWLLFTNWQLALLGLGALLLVRIAAAGGGARPWTESAAPAGYVPRWSVSRRLEAEREHAQWQEWFDAAR